MKIIKNILIVILTFININLVIGLIVSICFPKVLSGTINDLIINEVSYKNYKEPNIIINKDAKSTKDLVTTDSEDVNKILQSHAVQQLLEDYINKTISSINNPEELENIDFEKDAMDYIKQNKDKIEQATGIEITDETLNKVQNNLEEKELNNVVKQRIKNTSKNLTKEEKTILKAYSRFVSSTCRIIMISIFILNLLLIAIINKSFTKWINNFGISLLIGGIETIFLSFALKIIINFKNSFINFNISILIKWGFIIGVLGLIIIMVYNIIIKKQRKELVYE